MTTDAAAGSAVWTRLGVVGAVLLLVGGSWYQALVTPPYRFVDEQAHVGYVLGVQRGDLLPTIDTPIPDGGGEALDERLAWQPERRRDVWVANNPPHAYVVAAVPAAVTRALDLPGGPLLGLRLVNVAAAGAAVALTFRLGRDLAGGDRRVGLVAAALVAVVPHLGFVVALGFTDGLALLATTGVLLALARVMGAGPVTGSAAIPALGLWCAAAAAVRPMALVLAAAAAALAAVRVLVIRDRPVRDLLWLGGPATLLTGWWYALNVRRYGDPTASSALFEKFHRQPAGGVLDALVDASMWTAMSRTLTTRRLAVALPDDSLLVSRLALAVVVVGVVGAAVVVVVDRGAPAPWAAVGLVALVPVVLTAAHRAGGGGPHPRYLLPAVPVVAVAIALVAVRVAGRWGGLVLVGAGALVAAERTCAASRWLADNPDGPAGSALLDPIGGAGVRGAGWVVAAVGLALVAAALAAEGNSRPSR